MPIYEFYCKDCHTIFNFFARRIKTDTTPACPKCQKRLKKQMSMFATIGKAKESGGDDLGFDLDETKMERALGELAAEAENINEEDPRQMAQMMRKFSEKTGINLGDGMEEAIARMEAGEDPDKIEQEMGDLLEGEDPMSMFAKKRKGFSRRNLPPKHDETLYELE